MDNQWADPAGYGPDASDAPTIAYRILDRLSGKIVERVTDATHDYHRHRFFLSLNFADQEFADEHAELLQRACAYFYQEDGYVPLIGWPGSRTSDSEVRVRIARLDGGENTREADRMNQRRYPLDELPWGQQRALIEEIDRLKALWHFEIIGPVTTGEPRATTPPPPAYTDYGYDGA